MPVKTTLKKWIYILSVFATIIQTHFLCHIRQTTLGLNPKNHIQVQKEKNTLWSLVYFLHQMWKKAFLCHIHAVMEKKLTKAWSMCRAVVLIIKPKCFFHVLIPVTSSDLKVPTVLLNLIILKPCHRVSLKEAGWLLGLCRWLFETKLKVICLDSHLNVSACSLKLLTVSSSSNTPSKSIKALPMSLLSHLETQLEPPTHTHTPLAPQIHSLCYQNSWSQHYKL